MSDLQTFGPIVIPTQVGDAVIATMQTWMPAYCDWISREIGQSSGWLPTPVSYVVADDPDHWPEDATPAVVVVVSGTEGTPEQEGSRLYRACWAVEVVTYVTTADRSSTERLAKYYAAAVRQCLIQKGDLGGFAAGIKWRGERYDYKLKDLTQRTLGCSGVSLHVDVRQVARALGGPLTPPTDPLQVPPDFPVATTVTTQFA